MEEWIPLLAEALIHLLAAPRAVALADTRDAALTEAVSAPLAESTNPWLIASGAVVLAPTNWLHYWLHFDPHCPCMHTWLTPWH